MSPFGNGPSVEKLIADAKLGPIEAERIREILFVGDAPEGLRLQGATVEGPLNLKDARGPSGRDCDALILTNCTILGGGPESPGIDARHGRFSRIELINCATDGIALSGANVAGDLVVDGLHPREGQHGCWILARGLHVGGELSARSAALSLPWTPDGPWFPEKGGPWEDIGEPYALDLRNAQIGTWLVLQPEFHAVGGVSIGGATIGGELWMRGAELKAPRLRRPGEEHMGIEALFGQRATINGFADLAADASGRPTKLEGTLSFRAATFKGSLDIRGVNVSGYRFDSLYRDDEGVELSTATIAGSFILNDDAPALARVPIIHLDGVAIGGDLDIVVDESPPDSSDSSGAASESLADPREGPRIGEVKGRGVTVGGVARLIGSIREIDLSNAVMGRKVDIRISGSIKMPSSQVAGDLTIADGQTGPIKSLSMPSLKVGGDLVLAGELSGKADLQSAMIEGNLHLGGWDHPDASLTGDMTPDGDPRPLILYADNAEGPSSILLNEGVVRLGLHVNGIKDPKFVGIASHGHIRTAPLTVFPGWRLGQAQMDRVHGKDIGVLAFLYREQSPESGDQEQHPQVLVLDGDSSALYDHELLEAPQLDTPQQVDEYLALFCAHVWAEDGAFEIVDPRLFPEKTSANGAVLTPVSTPTFVDDSWVATKNVRYGEAIFRATFTIERDGVVEMTDDEPLQADLPKADLWGTPDKPLRRLDAEALSLFVKTRPPLGRWPHRHLPWAMGRWLRWRMPRSPWTVADSDLHDRLWPAVQGKVEPTINLEGLEVGALDDDGGRKWRDGLRLELSGFEYRRLHTKQESKPAPQESAPVSDRPVDTKLAFSKEAAPKKASKRGPAAATKPTDQVEDRESWLLRGVTFRPEPYERLAKLWRSEGRYADADHVTFTRLERERRGRDGGPISGKVRVSVFLGFVALMVFLGLIIWGPWDLGATFGSIVVTLGVISGLLLLPSRFLKRLFLSWPFGYGLKVSRAAGFVVVLWLVGGGLAFLGTYSFSPGTAALKIDTSSIGTVAGQSPNYPGAVLPVVTVTGTTGRDELACVGQIDPMMYALDVMVPLLDLRQEQRCRPSAEPGAWFLRYIKVVYAVLGWVAISGLVLTGSGVVRRQVEG